MLNVITSGDKDALRAAQIVAFTGACPGTIGTYFLAPEQIATENLEDAKTRGLVLQTTALLDPVEHVAAILYVRMLREGFEFSSAVGAGKKKARGRRNSTWKCSPSAKPRRSITSARRC